MGYFRQKNNLWFVDEITEHERHHHQIKKVLIKRKTKFQSMEILDSFSFGKCLVLDDDLQSAEIDEFIYHEALVHPSMVLHGNPKKVLILGGGEGATLREVLKWKTVKKAVMVDIDEEVVRWCKRLLPSYANGALEDKRAEVVIQDARKYVAETDEEFDVVISDLSSPVEGGPAYLLYTKEFYLNLLEKMNKKNSVFALQSDSFNITNIHVGATISRTLKKVFPIVTPYITFIPSFDALWGFLLCSNRRNPLSLSESQINSTIHKLVIQGLRFYDGRTHTGLFELPKYLRKEFRKKGPIITTKKPIFIYTGKNLARRRR